MIQSVRIKHEKCCDLALGRKSLDHPTKIEVKNGRSLAKKDPQIFKMCCERGTTAMIF